MFRGEILPAQRETVKEGEECECRLALGEEAEEQRLPLVGPSEV
jgi:hypothetical protein